MVRKVDYARHIHAYSLEEIKFLREHYWKSSDKELSELLRKSVANIKVAAIALKLHRAIFYGRPHSLTAPFLHYVKQKGVFCLSNDINDRLYFEYNLDMNKSIVAHLDLLSFKKHANTKLQQDFNLGHSFSVKLIRYNFGKYNLNPNSFLHSLLFTYPASILYNPKPYHFEY